MKKINQHKLDKILDLHKRWVEQDDKYPGERAVLSHHDLRGLDFSHRELWCIDLSYCDLRGSDLSNSNFVNSEFMHSKFGMTLITDSCFDRAYFEGSNFKYRHKFRGV